MTDHGPDLVDALNLSTDVVEAMVGVFQGTQDGNPNVVLEDVSGEDDDRIKARAVVKGRYGRSTENRYVAVFDSDGLIESLERSEVADDG